MNDRTKQRILEKATFVADALTVLAEKRDGISFEEYREQREARDVVEREFETAIDACIDIGKMLLRANSETVPDRNAQVFHELERVNRLDEETAQRMAEAAGFRNVLSHQYGNDIDDEDVYNVLQSDLPVFRDYLHQVREELE
jgi:uncharacterized protein YutE (UPF0331/DUF86 family)